MAQSFLVFYGSYRADRAGIRLARYLVDFSPPAGSTPS